MLNCYAMKTFPKHKFFLKAKYGIFVGAFFGLFFCMTVEIAAQEEPPAIMKVENRNWKLHSYGVRNRWFMDVYQCALYLDDENQNLESVLDLKHPVAIRIKILISELPDQVPDAWREAIKPEISDKLYSRFKKQIFKLEQGDQLTFTYLPGQSTVFFINNEKKFSDPGPDLMLALLEQWLGPQPVSEELKIELMKN